MGFTCATGEPLMCALIFSGKELEDEWVLGHDPFVEWFGGDNGTMEENTGKGKTYPQGPACELNGVNIPCFCCCSESGGIMAELLVEMLRVIDKTNALDRTDGIPPFSES